MLLKWAKKQIIKVMLKTGFILCLQKSITFLLLKTTDIKTCLKSSGREELLYYLHISNPLF